MGFSTNISDECPYCRRNTLFVNSNFRTGEYHLFCRACCFTHVRVNPTDSENNFIMLEDYYEIDGTVGFSSLRHDSSNKRELNDFIPLSLQITNGEFRKLDQTIGVYLIKLDSTEELGYKYLNFWFFRDLICKNGIRYLRHRYPTVEEIIVEGTGCASINKDNEEFFELVNEKNLNKFLEMAGTGEVNYITILRNGKLVEVFGKPWEMEVI